MEKIAMCELNEEQSELLRVATEALVFVHIKDKEKTLTEDQLVEAAVAVRKFYESVMAF